MAFKNRHTFIVMDHLQNAADVIQGTSQIRWREIEFHFDRPVTRTYARKHIEQVEGRIIKRKKDKGVIITTGEREPIYG